MTQTNYIETGCTFEHQGQSFESGGAVVTDGVLIAYLANDGVLTDWHGRSIGTWKELSSWPTLRSWVSSRMYSVECRVNGVRYVGRSAGIQMVVRAKRSPKQ